MEKSHEIKNIKFEGASLVITIDGEIKCFELKAISPALEKASAMEQSCWDILAPDRRRPFHRWPAWDCSCAAVEQKDCIAVF